MPDSNTLTLTPSEELLSFAEQSAISSLTTTPEEERRAEPRIPVIVPVLVQRVNEQMAGLDEPFVAVTRNITRNGFTIVAERWKSHHRFVIRVTVQERDYTLLAEEVWHRTEDQFAAVGLKILKQLKDQVFPLVTSS